MQAHPSTSVQRGLDGLWLKHETIQIPYSTGKATGVSPAASSYVKLGLKTDII